MTRHIVRGRKRRTSTGFKDEVLHIMYEVWLNGTKLGIRKLELINSIEIKETVEGADSATLQISDPQFLFIEDNIFKEESPIKIKLGWVNTTYRVEFEGYISAVDINFDTDGIPKLSITCMDNTHVMNRVKNSNTWKDKTNADVVKELVAKYGYTCEIEKDYKFEKQETITQSDQTDIEFITKLAGDEVYPFTARLVGKTFYYQKKGKLDTPKMSLNYRLYPHEVMSFNPKLNKETKKEEIKSASIDTGSKKVSTSTGKVEKKTGSSSRGGEKNNQEGGNKNSNTYTYNPATRSWSTNTGGIYNRLTESSKGDTKKSNNGKFVKQGNPSRSLRMR